MQTKETELFGIVCLEGGSVLKCPEDKSTRGNVCFIKIRSKHSRKHYCVYYEFL